MIKLEMSFNSLAELGDFISGKSSVNSHSAKVSVASESKSAPPANIPGEVSPQQKAAATRKANKAKKDAEAAAAADLANQQAAVSNVGLADNAATVMAQPVAQVAPVVQAAPTAINRDAYIARASELIGAMKNLGVSDADVLPQLQAAYAKHGIEWKQISLLDDNALPIVVSELEAFVNSISNQVAQPAAQPVSYV